MKLSKRMVALSLALSLCVPTVSPVSVEAAEIVAPTISSQFSDYEAEGKEFSFSFAGSMGVKRLPVHVYKGIVRVQLIGDFSGLEIAAYNKDMTKLVKKFKMSDGGIATAYFDKNQDISLAFKGDPGRGQTVTFRLSQYLSTNTKVAFNKIYSRYNKKGNQLIFKLKVDQTSDVMMYLLEASGSMELSVFDGDLRCFYTEPVVTGKTCLPLKKGTYYFMTESKCLAKFAFTCKPTVIAKSVESSSKVSTITLGKAVKVSIADSNREVPYVMQFSIPEKKKLSLSVSDVVVGGSSVSMEIRNAKEKFVEGSAMNFSSGVSGKWKSSGKYKKGTYYLFVYSETDGAYGSFNLRLD